MGLAPEFFILIGIDIFLGASILSALLDENLPGLLQYLFQGAGLLGLAQLFLGTEFMGTFFGGDPSGQARFWLSSVYLASAVVSIAGLNVYLAIIKKKFALAATFTGTVTVPAVMISVFLVYSFVSTGGDVVLSPATAFIIAVAALVSGFSILGFLRQALRHAMLGSLESKVASTQSEGRAVDSVLTATSENTKDTTPAGATMQKIGQFSFTLPSLQEDEWQEWSKDSSNGSEK